MNLPLSEFRALVNLVTPFVAKRDIIPILRHLVFRGPQIFAYDGGASGARVDTPWDFGAGFTLQAERLGRLLLAMEGLAEDITVAATNGRVRAAGGGFTGEFASLTVEEFPFPVVPDRRKAHPVPLEWGKLVQAALFSVSQDETKPALRGISAAGPWIRTSDNYRITRIRQTQPVEVFLPDILAARLGGVLGHVTHLAQTENFAVAFLPGGLAFGQLLNATFPKVDPLFTRYSKALAEEKTAMAVWAEDPGMVAMALHRVLLFAETDLLCRLRVTVKKQGTGGLVEFSTPEGGLEQAREHVPVDVRGPGAKGGVTFQVNGKMFLEAWERCPRFLVAQPVDLPLYFQASDKTFEHLLMRLAE